MTVVDGVNVTPTADREQIETACQEIFTMALSMQDRQLQLRTLLDEGTSAPQYSRFWCCQRLMVAYERRRFL